MLIFKGESPLNLHSPKYHRHMLVPCQGSSQQETPSLCSDMCPQVKKQWGLWRWGAVPCWPHSRYCLRVQDLSHKWSQKRRMNMSKILSAWMQWLFYHKEISFPSRAKFPFACLSQGFHVSVLGVLMTLFSMRNSYTWRLTSICNVKSDYSSICLSP